MSTIHNPMNIGVVIFSRLHNSTCDYVDIDECAINTAGCNPKATCTNTIGSFTCTCLPGYGGDGFTCEGKLD